MARRRLPLAVVACLTAAVMPAYGITVEINGTNLQPEDTCQGPHTPGGTQLADFRLQQYYNVLEGNDPGSWGPGYADSMIQAMRTQYPTWTFSFANASLQSTLSIDWFKAVDNEGNVYIVDADGNWRFEEDPNGPYCFHGAEFTAHYVVPSGESGLSLDWIQLRSSWGDMGSDHLIVDGKEDTSPAYYTILDDRIASLHIPNPGGLVFGDSPGVPHDESSPWSGGADFVLLLASFNYLNRTVTLYDGIEWGYSGECRKVIVPEPLSVFLGLLGLLALSLRNSRGTYHRR